MYGQCLLCNASILIPGEDGYLCSSRICGAKIVIKDSKTKKVVSTHPPKGWVKYADVPELLRRAKAEREKQERRARMEESQKSEVKSQKSASLVSSVRCKHLSD